METTDRIIINNEERLIEIEAGKAKYANETMPSVDNVKQALDSHETRLGNVEVGGGASTSAGAAKYKNNPLPFHKDTFKILALGNSFTFYPTRPLEALLTAASADKSKFGFKMTYTQGYSLANYFDAVINNTTPMNNYSAGGGTLSVSASGGVRTALAHDWDIIILQQKSSDAKNYATYEPYLTKLVNLIRTHCTNPRVCIAFQQTWSINQGDYAAQDAEWTNICNAVKSVVGINGIDVIIPSGTAMQNARHTATFYNTNNNTNHYLMADSTGHPADGAGRYVLACAWYQALFAPLLGLPSIVGNSATLEATESDTYTDSLIDVTSENKEILQKCAMAACTNLWSITDDIDPITE